MSLDISGADKSVQPGAVTVLVGKEHPLIMLANALPWAILISLAMEDLKRTTVKGYWWLGRRLLVRVHVAAYILQKIFDLTDREVEYGLNDNAAYQLFAGKGIVAKWHAPDHTKIAAFRSRLSPETQRTIANETARVAVGLGLADPSETDIDSTVQEANIAYPSDDSLMTKLAAKGRQVLEYLKEKTRLLISAGIAVDMKALKAKARAYFFLPKTADIERRRSVFKDLHRFTKHQMRPVVDLCSSLDSRQLRCLPWNIRRAAEQIKDQAWRYLLDVGHFTRTHTIKAVKVLAFHARDVACIRKGKVGKDNEFGRVFQLGRIKGNFLFALASTSVRQDDKASLVPMLEEHANLFGSGALKSAGADKGYWTANNLRAFAKRGIQECGLQCPGNVKRRKGLPSPKVQERLRNRRAGIEALIGHTKLGGQLGKSRMKSDAATLAAGYASVLGFNLRQISRYQKQRLSGAKAKVA